jgi:hypothetical protein
MPELVPPLLLPLLCVGQQVIPTHTMRPSRTRPIEWLSFLVFQTTNLNTVKPCPIQTRDVSKEIKFQIYL